MTGTLAVLVGGHLTDAPDRPQPRFPQRLVEPITRRVGKVYDGWGVGSDTTIVCGGARGSDIIGAEQGLARLARVIVCLAMAPDDFERASVAQRGTDWSQRYHHLLSVAEVRLVPGGKPNDSQPFARANAAMVATARDLDPHPHALIVWDGQGGDGPGGTFDLVERLGYAIDDPHVAVIDPTSL
jgi:hypothetical protein